IDAIDAAFCQARRTQGQPIAIIARTVKGRGVRAVENVNGAHGKPVPDADEAIAELGGIRDLTVQVMPPQSATAGSTTATSAGPQDGRTAQMFMPGYELGESVATRSAFGEAL